MAEKRGPWLADSIRIHQDFKKPDEPSPIKSLAARMQEVFDFLMACRKYHSLSSSYNDGTWAQITDIIHKECVAQRGGEPNDDGS